MRASSLSLDTRQAAYFQLTHASPTVPETGRHLCPACSPPTTNAPSVAEPRAPRPSSSNFRDHLPSNPHDPRFQNPRALFPIFVLRDILFAPQTTAVIYSPHMAAKNPKKKPKATLDSVLSTVKRGFTDLEGKKDRGFAAVADDIADIKIKMATKDDIANLGGQLTSIEGELKSIRRDLDDLREKVENVSGFQKEIDHALERIAAIEKHLGLDKKIAA